MKQSYNPFLPLNEYIPDGEPHVFGDRVYLFGSHDKAGGSTFCMQDYCFYSAPVDDLSNWTNKGVNYSVTQDPNRTEERKYMYAPDVVQGNDGRYYLYYALGGYKGRNGFDGPISVAVCDSPDGRYKYYGDVRNKDGSPFLRMIPFDPAVINDAGKIRLYYGWSLPVKRPKTMLTSYIIHRIMQSMFSKSREEIKAESEGIMGANTVELGDDMLTVVSEPKRIIPAMMNTKGTGFEGHGFFEASSIRKIGGLYYFIYSSQKYHELCYAVSSYPDKDFRYGGVIVSSGDIGLDGRTESGKLAVTGNNHGSIECINGCFYIFYHRHTHNTSYSRQACAEEITINTDGSIKQVQISSCGLNREPLKPDGKYPAVIACNLTNKFIRTMPTGINRKVGPCITEKGDEHFITRITSGTLIGIKYFDFKGRYIITVNTRSSSCGKLFVSVNNKKFIGVIEIRPSSEWTNYSCEIELNGIHPLNLTYRGKGFVDLLNLDFKHCQIS